MQIINLIPLFTLQLFAEGAGGAGAGAGDGGTAEGSGVTAPAAGVQKGVKNPLANVKYGIQEETAPAAEVNQPDRNAEFEALIKGQYKDLYDAKMQDTIQKRLKGQKEVVDKFNSLTPTLELLASKYGVDVGDIEALNAAIEEDDSFYEQEAMDRGMTVKDYKAFRKMEKENAALKAQMDEAQKHENGKKLFAQWMQQADETKKVYPSFNLEAEMNNQKFLDLLKSNVDVRTAYEVTHKDEIIAGAMQFTAKTVEQKVANKIAANGARPVENGMSSQSSSLVKSDVSQLSREDRAEIIRRVQRGEKIKF